MRFFVILGLIVVMYGCASITKFHEIDCEEKILECRESATVENIPTTDALKSVSPPKGEKVVVAVYQFLDKTGQRKYRDNFSDFSTAVTQGAETLLIDALKTAGKGEWFRVVERTNIDALVKERQIIRSAREEFNEKKKLSPLLFAGLLAEGGIVGYDTNLESGGRGARWLGIGASTTYRRDSVVVSVRVVSTLTGEVLLNVQTKKTILSVGGGYDVFRFFDMDTKLLEIEDGNGFNESVTYATRSAIEVAVLELIYQGHDRGYWEIEGEHRHPHMNDGTNDRHQIKEKK